jgi:hypothetical protein
VCEPRLRDILSRMRPSIFTRPRYRQAYRLAAVVLVATACGFTGALANAESGDLITAAERGDLPVVNALLASHADVNVRKYLTHAFIEGHHHGVVGSVFTWPPGGGSSAAGQRKPMSTPNGPMWTVAIRH